MADKSGTIELHYLKTHFIGPSGLGKTTTRQRLVGSITNLSLLPEDQRKRCSTLLVECEQVLSFVDKSGTKLEFKASSSLEEETQFIFSYLMSCEPIEDSTVSNTSTPKEQPKKETTDPKKLTQLKIDEAATVPKETVSPTPEPPEKVVKVTTVDVGKVVSRLRSIVGSGEYTKELLNKVLLNLIDIGGQPGFVEMFPFLSKGAGIFLVFFRLDKDLDDMCQVSYERGKDKITPYDSTYTSRETLSQILSAINYHTKIDSDIDREQCSKLGNLGSAKPVATLIGTFKDELAMQIKVDLLYEKCFASTKALSKSDSTTASKSDSTTASKSDSTTADKSNSTTASKSDSTTADKSDSTTTSKSDSTTASKSDSTTADKSDSTTASKSDSTTVDKSNGTTASKSHSTTDSKSDSTTASKSDSTTADKSNSTTADKSNSTTASKSDSTTADKSDSTTADKSDSTTASKSDSTTTDKSDSTTASKSDSNTASKTTASKSDSTTASKSNSTTASKTTASKSDSTTADKSDTTTASKSDSTTASKTTASKSDSTTADKSDSTTASKSDSTTASKSDSTTASRSDSTTASKSDSTTADKSDSTTASKSDSTTADKSDSTTADKSNSTTASKSDSTTASKATASKSDSTIADKSDSATASKSDSTTADKSDSTTADKSDSTTASKSDSTTASKTIASKSDSTTADKSDSTTSSKSDSTTASRSDSTTADKSDSTTASKSNSTTASKSDSTTADKSDSTTASKSDSTTADKSDSTTADKSNSTTASKSDSTTASKATSSKSDSTIADKSDSATASKSDSTTADKSDSTTADKSDSTTASKSDSTTASKTIASKSDSTTADKSDSTTSSKSDSTIASRSDSTTADKSDSTTASKSNSTTASKSDSTTASKSDSTTADKSDSTTASKSDSTTADKSDSTTADKSNSTTASKSDSTTASKATASKSDSTTADKSDSTTASKSDSTTASKSDSTTASRSDSTTASKSDSTTVDKSDSTTASKSDSTTADKSLNEHEKKKAIRNVLNQQKSDEHANVSADDMAAIEQTVSQHLNSDTFKKDVQDRLEQKLTEKNEAVTKITSKFEKLLSNPKDKKFIAVDNYEGTDSDMEPLREHLHGIFSSYFKDAKLRIRPQQLLLGVVLRKEYDIVSMEDCIRIGTEGLKMTEKEVRFTVWYLDRYIGALIYHPEIKDKDGWFGNFVICNPQVVFNSLSVFVVKPLLELHFEEGNIQFNDNERKNWILKGQFLLKTITRCHSEENQGVKKDQLIPIEKLLILLEHSHLLAKITTVEEDHTTEEVETTYFIPAILKCASREELTKPPPTGIDTPSPIKITFKPQYVPIGVFCAMISELVSRGSTGILGMTWKLAADTSVKRNLVSFHIDESAKHFVTLISHVDCYEIRIIRQNRKYTMHELCSYVLSTLLLVMKDISPLLSPIIAFDCYCGRHENATKLCVLTPGLYPSFNCTSEVSLSPHQKCWFAEVSKPSVHCVMSRSFDRNFTYIISLFPHFYLRFQSVLTLY